MQKSGRKVVNHFSSLTGLRFLAAIWVVLLHNVNLNKLPHLIAIFVGRGYLAVDVFFVLSGFILTLNYVDPDTAAFKGTRTKFWLARFARIYPAYLLALVLWIGPAVIQFLNHQMFSSIPVLVGTGLLTAVLQQCWWYRTATMWNYPAWSVAVEAFFYIVFPAACVLATRFPPRRLRFALAVCWCAALTFPVLGFVQDPVAGYSAMDTDAVRYTLMTNPVLRLPEFAFGILLGRMFQLNVIPLKMLNGMVAVGLFLAACAIFSPQVPRVLLGNGLLAPAWGVFIYALACGRPGPIHRLLSLPLLVLLGEASYGIYILQAPVAEYWFHNYTGPLKVPLFLLLLPLLAVLSFWYFETPVRNIIRRTAGERPVLIPSAADIEPRPAEIIGVAPELKQSHGSA